MAFEYYYGKQADQYNFIKVPKLLVHDDAFTELSVDAKMLYGLLLDRMNLSMKNGWLDEQNRVYIIYQIKDIMSDMNMARATAVKYLQELVDFGLVEKKKRGLGLPNILYVKSFLVEKETPIPDKTMGNLSEKSGENMAETPINIQKFKNYTSRSSKNEIQEVQKLNFKEFKNYTSGSSEVELQEVQDLNPSNTNINNTKYNNTNLIKSYPYTEKNEAYIQDTGAGLSENIMGTTMPKSDVMRLDEKKCEYELYKELIKKNIEYDALKERHPTDAALIDGIVEMMTEVTVSTSDYIVIASNSFPKEVVKSRFLKLNFSHMEYVIDCFNANTTKVKNIKKYLLASLFNAPLTMDGYYSAEVNHDMPQYARKR